MTEHDQTMSWVVRRNPYAYSVPDHNSNIKSSHLAAKFCANNDFILEFHLIDAPSESIDHFSVNLY